MFSSLPLALLCSITCHIYLRAVKHRVMFQVQGVLGLQVLFLILPPPPLPNATFQQTMMQLFMEQAQSNAKREQERHQEIVALRKEELAQREKQDVRHQENTRTILELAVRNQHPPPAVCELNSDILQLVFKKASKHGCILLNVAQVLASRYNWLVVTV